MIDISQNESLVSVLVEGFKHYARLVFNKAVLLPSVILGMILTAIGYPKSILMFITTLVVIDTITKVYAVVKKHYENVTLKNFLYACSTNKISSKNMKNGLGVKAFFYLVVLYMAHQASIHAEIMGGEYISSVLYSLLFVIEGKSITENLRDCGYNGLNSILKFFDNKEDELVNKK